MNQIYKTIMLEMSKKILMSVSFDRSLFRKELAKSIRWIKREERLLLKAWCVVMFGNQYSDVIQEVFSAVVA
ncbi:MAG: hypothetical protein ACXITV_09480 [Luteibaculaceae bacterium]